MVIKLWHISWWKKPFHKVLAVQHHVLERPICCFVQPGKQICFVILFSFGLKETRIGRATIILPPFVSMGRSNSSPSSSLSNENIGEGLSYFDIHWLKESSAGITFCGCSPFLFTEAKVRLRQLTPLQSRSSNCQNAAQAPSCSKQTNAIPTKRRSCEKTTSLMFHASRRLLFTSKPATLHWWQSVELLTMKAAPNSERHNFPTWAGLKWVQLNWSWVWTVIWFWPKAQTKWSCSFFVKL